MKAVSKVRNASDAVDAPAARKDRLVEVAMALFGERGFSGTSVRDLAIAAGVKMGSIYNFFEGKRDLHSAVLEKAYGILHAYIAGVDLVDGDHEGNLRRVFAATTAFFHEQPMAHRVIMQELLVNAEGMDSAIELHLRKTRAIINGILRDGIDARVFRTVDVEMFSYGLMSASFGYFSSRALFIRLFRDPRSEMVFTSHAPFPLFDFALQSLKAAPERVTKPGRSIKKGK